MYSREINYCTNHFNTTKIIMFIIYPFLLSVYNLFIFLEPIYNATNFFE